MLDIILLSAGYGTRLRPITNLIPKCLVPILGRPLLDYWCELINSSSYAGRVYINTHYLSNQVQNFLANKVRFHIIFEPVLLGTAGTVRKILPQISTESILIAHADNLTLFSVDDFYLKHLNRPSNCVMTMMTFQCDDPSNCGILNVDENDVMNSFIEKPKNMAQGIANGAVYIIEKKFLKSCLDDLSINDISTQILPSLIGQCYTYNNSTYHKDIGSLAAYQMAQSEFGAVYSVWKKGGGK